ncbi:hypothetical protein F383_22094 [Gossypium arboreum]|uniref:Uncharacterized protein n=2 Tax=Gossypium arboreum TaxID=29729 RepID=A0A0B0NZU4_GOSAR|nr:hypothetical protein F383_22094 [Gossypium arboreum]
MSSTEEGGGAVGAPGGAVSNDQTITTNNNPLETIIPMPDTDFTLSKGELENLRSLDESFDGNQLDPNAKPLIRRVPSTLGCHEDFRKYFKPKVIQIGPLHNDDPTLHGSQNLKQNLVKCFTKNIGVNTKTLYENMKKEIDGLKKCYDPKELEKYSNGKEKLAWILFVDGCAILQAVYIRYGQDYNSTLIERCTIKEMLTFEYSDLFLLENQLPFRVLELLTSSSKNGEKFMNAIKRFIDYTVITPAEMKESQSHQQDSLKMSSTEEGSGTVGAPGRAVSADQTIINNNPLETIIPIQCTNFLLSNGELENLRSLDEAFKGNQLEPTAKPLIQRVPSTLGRHKDFRKYFKPKVISIGPLHHDDPTLHGSEKLKLKLAAHFVKNIGVNKETLYNNMKTEIGGLKKCYDPKELEKYSNDDEKLAWMFFVDGSAILQAIYMRYGNDDVDDQDNDPMPNELLIKNDLLTYVYLDLFLLENQLPFRVLELLTSWGENGEKFMKAIKRFIDDNVITPAEMKEPQSHQQDR